MITFGIDFGITSPALCCRHGNSFDFYFFPKLKNQKGFKKKIQGNIKVLDIDNPIYTFEALEYPTYKTREERFEKISKIFMDKILEIIKIKNADIKDIEILIEGYAFGITGSRSMSGLYEIGGLIRNKLHLSGLTYEEISPTSIKKSFTNFGNANQFPMGEWFKERTGINLYEMFGIKMGSVVPKPVEDLQDVFAISIHKDLKNQAINKPTKEKRLIRKSRIVGNLINRMQEKFDT